MPEEKLETLVIEIESGFPLYRYRELLTPTLSAGRSDRFDREEL
jgi:hypothetical protein